MKVKKRDGRVEKYYPDKLMASVISAGLTDTEAKDLTLHIEAWAKERFPDGIIEAQSMWDQVYETLTSKDPEIAQNYKTFREFLSRANL